MATQLAAALAIQALVLAIIGAGAESDAFFAAQTLPTVVLAIVTISLQSVWQPRLSVLTADSKRWRDRLSAAQGQVLTVLGGSSLLLIATSEWWVRVLFPGFAPQQHGLVSALTSVLLAASVLSGHSALYVTALRSKGGFVLAEVIPLACWLISIVAIAMTVPRYGVMAAAWVTFARAATTTLALHFYSGAPLPSARKGLRDTESWHQLRPLLSGSALYKTVPMVDRYWSSQAGAGALTIYNLAQLGMGSIATVIDRSISVPNIPRMARLVESRDWDSVRKTYRSVVARISILALVIAALFLAAKGIWAQVALAVLKMPADLSMQLWSVCLLLGGYLYASAAAGIVVAAFYAMGDTRTSMRVGVIGFAPAIALKSVCFMAGGISGLALATSAYFACNLAVLSVLLEKRLSKLALEQR